MQRYYECTLNPKSFQHSYEIHCQWSTQRFAIIHDHIQYTIYEYEFTVSGLHKDLPLFMITYGTHFMVLT